MIIIKKKRMREKTPLFIGKKEWEFAFTYRTCLVGNEIILIKRRWNIRWKYINDTLITSYPEFNEGKLITTLLQRKAQPTPLLPLSFHPNIPLML